MSRVETLGRMDRRRVGMGNVAQPGIVEIHLEAPVIIGDEDEGLASDLLDRPRWRR